MIERLTAEQLQREFDGLALCLMTDCGHINLKQIHDHIDALEADLRTANERLRLAAELEDAVDQYEHLVPVGRISAYEPVWEAKRAFRAAQPDTDN